MIENVKAVSNPLSVIAIFAALAEVAGTVVLALVDKSIQSTFVWFVMLFPVLIVLFFFLTLNFNSKVLYAPSDFKDEENFLQTMHGAKWIDRSLREINGQIEAAKEAIAIEVTSPPAATDHAHILQALNEDLLKIQATIRSTRITAESLSTISTEKLPNSYGQARIIRFLRERGGEATLNEIRQATGFSDVTARRTLQKLTERGSVFPSLDKNSYRLDGTPVRPE